MSACDTIKNCFCLKFLNVEPVDEIMTLDKDHGNGTFRDVAVPVNIYPPYQCIIKMKFNSDIIITIIIIKIILGGI